MAGGDVRAGRAVDDVVLEMRDSRPAPRGPRAGFPAGDVRTAQGPPRGGSGELQNESPTLMRQRSIAGIRLRRLVRATVPDPSGTVVGDLVGWDFTTQAPNSR